MCFWSFRWHSTLLMKNFFHLNAQHTCKYQCWNVSHWLGKPMIKATHNLIVLGLRSYLNFFCSSAFYFNIASKRLESWSQHTPILEQQLFGLTFWTVTKVGSTRSYLEIFIKISWIMDNYELWYTWIYVIVKLLYHPFRKAFINVSLQLIESGAYSIDFYSFLINLEHYTYQVIL